jgi:hypothetical protein
MNIMIALLVAALPAPPVPNKVSPAVSGWTHSSLFSGEIGMIAPNH